MGARFRITGFDMAGTDQGHGAGLRPQCQRADRARQRDERHRDGQHVDAVGGPALRGAADKSAADLGKHGHG